MIALFYFGERSQKEISTFLQIPISTVKNRLFSARKRLKPRFNTMVEDYLSNQCPSQDNAFANKIDRIIDAACSGDNDTIQTLLKQDARLANVKSREINSTPLHFAAHRGHLNIVKLLLFTGADINAKEGNYSKSTPLHWAAKGGHLEVVKHDELQPLHYAIRNNKTEIAELLIQQGASLQAKTRFGIFPLSMAILADNQQIVRILTNHNLPQDLATLLILEQWSQAESIIDRQPNLIAENPLLLHYTIKQGLLAATSWLLKKGADIEIGNSYQLDDYVANLTPLQVAVEASQVKIAQLLIESGADVNAVTTGELELTALHGAAARGNLDLIRLLIKHQANLNAKDNVDGRTPLDYAREFKHEAAIELLKQIQEK